MDVPVKLGTDTYIIPGEAVSRAEVLAPSVPSGLAPGGIEAALDVSLDAGSTGPPFADCIASNSSTCIIVSDRTRKYGLHSWLPHLLDRLNALGVQDSSITVLVATGAHETIKPAGGNASSVDAERREAVALVGDETASRVDIVFHDCDDTGGIRHVGITEYGNRVAVNKLALDARNLIITGVVMPHYYAGFTGGRKSILPGVAARKCIFYNHSMNLAPGGGTRHEASVMNLDGNPIHEDMMEAMSFVDVAFGINVIMGSGGSPAEFHSGDPVRAHLSACAAMKEYAGAAIRRRADWVIASCGGHPSDINFYQSHKSLDNSFKAVREGGVIVLFTECPEGLGPAGFRAYFEMGSIELIEKQLRKEYVVPGHTAMRILQKTGAAKVILVTSLPDADAELVGAHRAVGADDAMREIMNLPGKGIIIPSASNTVPCITE